MSEDSSTPEFPALEADSAEKAPRKKKAATKSPAKPADQAKAQPKESEVKAPENTVESDSPAKESSPRPIKKGVRVVKTAAAKKTSAKKGSKNTPSQEGDSKPDQAQEKNSDAPAQGASEANSGDESGKQQRRGRGRNRSGRQQDQQQEAPKAKIDTKIVAARAWKIFVGEVNEEGLALIADKDAREMARRSLRIAEIYTREEAMQLQKGKKTVRKGKAEQKDSEETQETKANQKD